jgi:protein TonB
MELNPPAFHATAPEFVVESRMTAYPPAVAIALSPSQTRWVRLPSSDALERAFPTAALSRGVSGFAVLQCTVAQGGHLEGCQVGSENPAGYGFGRAALSLRSQFLVDSTSVAVGTLIRFRIDFSLPY